MINRLGRSVSGQGVTETESGFHQCGSIGQGTRAFGPEGVEVTHLLEKNMMLAQQFACLSETLFCVPLQGALAN